MNPNHFLDRLACIQKHLTLLQIVLDVLEIDLVHIEPYVRVVRQSGGDLRVNRIALRAGVVDLNSSILPFKLRHVIESLLSFHFLLEELPPFEAPILEAVSCRWVKLCEISELISVETHHDVLFSVEILAGHLTDHIGVALIWDVGAHDHVWVQVQQDLIISIHCLTLQNHKRWQRFRWVLLNLVVEAERPLHDEVHFVHLMSMGHNYLVGIVLGVASREQPDYRLVDETLVTGVKKVAELHPEVCKD